MSPEIRSNRSKFDGHAVDVWALGPILFLMVAGFPPFEIADLSDERFYHFSRGYFQQIVTNWNLGLKVSSRKVIKPFKRILSTNCYQLESWIVC